MSFRSERYAEAIVEHLSIVSGLRPAPERKEEAVETVSKLLDYAWRAGFNAGREPALAQRSGLTPVRSERAGKR